MGTVLDSLNNMLASAANNGIFTRTIFSTFNSATTATTSSGYMVGIEATGALTMPSLGSGLTGAYFTYIRMMRNAGVTMVAGLSYTLGTLTISGNSFADGVAMPTKSVRVGQASTSITTATQMALLVATANLTATTPVITITYTDQDGNTGQTATLTLPTNALSGSVFLIDPHLASGDTGIRDITNMSTSAGTAGTLVVRGILVLGASLVGSNQLALSTNNVALPVPMWLVETNDVIRFYAFGSNASGPMLAVLSAIADN